MVKLYLIVLSILIINQFVEGQKRQTNDNNNVRKRSFDLLGLFDCDEYSSETKLKDKLRISKGFIKREIRYKNSVNNSSPIFSGKMNYREDLVRCDNLTLAQTDQQQLIDCQPLESFILDQTYNFDKPSLDSDKETISESKSGFKSNSNLYAKKTSARRKFNYFKLSPDYMIEYQIYSLRQDVVDRNIDSIVAGINLNQLNYQTMGHNKMGYYFQAYLSNNRKMNIGLECSGNLFISINETRFFSKVSNETYSEFEDEYEFVVQQGIDNGFLISLQSFTCKPVDQNQEQIFSPLEIGVNMEFTMVMKKDFPYFTLRHNMKVTPIEEIFTYDAHIDQIRSPEDHNNPYKYNTTVKITSRSGLYDSINFDLNQNFSSISEHEGSEQMNFFNPYIQSSVTSTWDENIFVKIFTLFDTDKIKKKIDTMFFLLWTDRKDEDMIDLNIKIKKDILKIFSLERIFNINTKEPMINKNGTLSLTIDNNQEQEFTDNSIRYEL